MNSNRLFFGAALACGLSVLTACGGGGGGGGAGSPAPTPIPSATVTGTAAKGLLLNAIVTFYSVTAGVENTTALTSVRTDAKTGGFSAPVSSAGPVVIVVTTDTSTQMLDELSGIPIAAPPGLSLHAVVDSIANLQPVSVTPLTEMAYDIAKAASGGLIPANIDAGNNAVSTAFLAGAPVMSTLPIDIKTYTSATAAEQEQAKLLVALAVAANEGIATGISGAPCTGTYSANLVCLIGGLGKLLTINSSGAVSLAAASAYVSDAYNSIDSGSVTVAGGQTPSALGLTVPTAAETTFVTAITKQAPLPGYNANADPLVNTKALFANVRTNILDQATTQTFGYAPTLTALTNDYENNVHPVISGTSSIAGAAYEAAQLIQFGTTSSASLGTPSPYISNPVAIATDAAGNLYVVNSNQTIAKVTAGTTTLFAGQRGVTGSADGPAAQATFTSLSAIAVDSGGNVYVADNNTIREVTSGGVVSTIAGQPGNYGHADGTGAAASFGYLTGLAIDATGMIFAADAGNTAIRVIAPAGAVSTFVVQPGYVCGSASSGLESMGGIAVDSLGNLYLTAGALNAVQKITPGGVITTLAGQCGSIPGYTDGAGSIAQFSYPSQLTIDGVGNLYVVDSFNTAIRKVTPGGVSTVAKTRARNGIMQTSDFGLLNGIALNGAGNIYVADWSHSSIQEVDAAGAISTYVHSQANYQGMCGFDPIGLGTASNVALCRYGLKNSQILLTVTQSGASTYSLQTQALVASSGLNTAAYNPITSYYSIVATIPALQSVFTWTTVAGGPQSATFTGPYYVNASGGRVQGSLSVAESSDWNAGTGTGTITLGGSLSGGAGGVSLVSASIGSDSVLTIQNGARLLTTPVPPVVSAGLPAVTISGAIDLTALTTNAFTYALKASLGAPILDKSKALGLPGTISATGSITQLGASGAIPVFSGTVSANFQGLPHFDATLPISATNFFTAQAQFEGTLSLPGGRVLTVAATANATQLVATPAQPDSISATYSYTTPSGTATLDATGQYDATKGYQGTITNNAGVVVAVSYPVGGPLAGTVTANGVSTATIKGAFIYYSDGTSESLY